MDNWGGVAIMERREKGREERGRKREREKRKRGITLSWMRYGLLGTMRSVDRLSRAFSILQDSFPRLTQFLAFASV